MGQLEAFVIQMEHPTSAQQRLKAARSLPVSPRVRTRLAWDSGWHLGDCPETAHTFTVHRQLRLRL